MPGPDRLARDLVGSCMELHRRRSWNRVTGDAPFLLRVPGEEEPLVGVLMGQAGEEFGLFLARGPDALDQLFGAFSSGDPVSSHIDSLDLISLAFDRLGEIPDEFRAPLRLAGFQTRRENIAPFLFARPLHRQPRAPSKREMKTLLWCLRGIFAAEDRGDLRPAPLVAGRNVLELEIGGAVRTPEVKARFVPWSASPVSGAASPVLLPADLKSLPRTERRWLASAPPLPGRVEGDDRAWRALILFDRESGEPLSSRVVPRGDPGSLVPPLAEALRAEGLPREIVFDEEALLDVLAPGLAGLSVSAVLDPDEPRFAELREILLRGPERKPGTPETLEEWKDADRDYCERQAELLIGKNRITPRALARYFGGAEEADEVLSELSDLGPVPALIEWLAADYRATKRSKTHLEKRLQERRLDPVDRTLIEARRDALLSIFRVDSVQLGASFEVEDVLSGERYRVEDRALSACGIEGIFLPLRLIRLQEWYFPLIAGPPLPIVHVSWMLGRLESIGASLDREGMREGAHLVGRLWQWCLEARDNPPRLRNTDGDPIEWHRARFHVADPPAFAKALERREDVDVDEPGASWTWSREGGPAPGMGDRTTLGTFELFDDSLLLEVNSARRLERALEWVEKLPGVHFEIAQLVEPGDSPLDDRLPGPPPEPVPDEVRAQLAGFMAENARRWLDESVPALGGLTPRAACATAEGRRRVEQLIRTMPPMRVPGGEIPAPREELLRELGLRRP